MSSDGAKDGILSPGTKAHQRTWLQSLGSLPPLFALLSVHILHVDRLLDSSDKLQARKPVKVEGQQVDLAMDVRSKLRVPISSFFARGLQKSVNGVPQLPNCIMPEESEVPIEKAADAPNMPLTRIFHRQILAPR